MKTRKTTAAVTAATNGATVSGYGAVFNEITRLGDIYEMIEPGAFDGAQMNDVKFLIDHKGTALARTTAGTLGLILDQRGLRYVASLADTERAHEITEAARRGDVTQSSFAFTIAADRWEQHEGAPLRVIEKIGRVYEVSAVSFPAYEGTAFEAVEMQGA